MHLKANRNYEQFIGSGFTTSQNEEWKDVWMIILWVLWDHKNNIIFRNIAQKLGVDNQYIHEVKFSYLNWCLYPVTYLKFAPDQWYVSQFQKEGLK